MICGNIEELSINLGYAIIATYITSFFIKTSLLKKGALIIALIFIFIGLLYVRNYYITNENNKKVIDISQINKKDIMSKINELKKNEEWEQLISEIEKLKAFYDFNRKTLHSKYYNLLGLSYFKIGNYKKSLIFLDLAINLNSKNDKYFFNRGVLYFEIGEIEKSKKDFEMANNINKKNENYYYLGKILYKKENYSEAKKIFSNLQQSYLYENKLIDIEVTFYVYSYDFIIALKNFINQ